MLTLNDVVGQYWNIIVLHHLFCNKNKSSYLRSAWTVQIITTQLSVCNVFSCTSINIWFYLTSTFFLMKVLSKMISLTLLQPIFRDWVIHTIPFLLKWFNHVFALHLHQFKVQMLKGHTYLRMPFSKMSPPYWR